MKVRNAVVAALVAGLSILSVPAQAKGRDPVEAVIRGPDLVKPVVVRGDLGEDPNDSYWAFVLAHVRVPIRSRGAVTAPRGGAWPSLPRGVRGPVLRVPPIRRRGRSPRPGGTVWLRARLRPFAPRLEQVPCLLRGQVARKHRVERLLVHLRKCGPTPIVAKVGFISTTTLPPTDDGMPFAAEAGGRQGG